MDTFTVPRDGKRSLRFVGEAVAAASSHSHQGPDQNRWHELRLYKTQSGKYVLVSVHRTCWQGESDTRSAYILATTADVLRKLETNDDDDDIYLSGVAKELLDDAGIDYSVEVE